MASKLLITPFNGSTTVGQDPTIAFRGTSNSTDIILRVTAAGDLSFEGTVGQLLSITNSLTGTIFSVNDISGIPSIEVLDTGLVKLNEFSGDLSIGGPTNLTNQVTLLGTTDSTSLTTGSAIFSGGVAIAKNNFVGGYLATASGTTGAGFFGLGTVLTSGAAANDTSLRWDGTSGSLNFSYGSARVGYITSAGALNLNGGVTASGTVTAHSYISLASSNYGYGLWNGGPLTFGMLMSDSVNGTYGGRISGETTSDYNLYFSMGSGGTNRGFLFRNAYATPLFAINGDAVRSNVPLNINYGTSFGIVVTGTAATAQNSIRATGTTTAANYVQVDNTTGSILIGVASSAGAGGGLSGMTAYAAFIEPNASPNLTLGGGSGNNKTLILTGLTAAFASTVSATQFTGPVTALKSATTSVDVSSATAPVAGQVLTASSSTVAAWAAPSVSSDIYAFAAAYG